MVRHQLPGQRRVETIVWAAVLVAVFFLSAACGRKTEPKAVYAPIAQIEQSYGRLIATANMPTPDQNGTGDRLGLFRDDTGTIWGIPLIYDEGGKLLGCAP